MANSGCGRLTRHGLAEYGWAVGHEQSATQTVEAVIRTVTLIFAGDTSHPARLAAWNALPESIRQSLVSESAVESSALTGASGYVSAEIRLIARIASRQAQVCRLLREGDRTGAVLVGAKWSEAVAIRDEFRRTLGLPPMPATVLQIEPEVVGG